MSILYIILSIFHAYTVYITSDPSVICSTIYCTLHHCIANINLNTLYTLLLFVLRCCCLFVYSVKYIENKEKKEQHKSLFDFIYLIDKADSDCDHCWSVLVPVS